MDSDNGTILNNTPEETRFRRNSNTLVILGSGVIIFGVWAIIKLGAQFIFGAQLFTPKQLEETNEIDRMIIMGLAFFMLTIDVILRLIAGRRAIREGRGMKVRRGYLFILAWLVLASVFSVCLVTFDILSTGEYLLENYVAIFMELSSLSISLEVFITAISVRRYKSKRIKEATKNAG